MDNAKYNTIKKRLEEEKNNIEEDLKRFAQPTEKEGDFESEFENIGRDRDDNAHEVEDYGGKLALENTLEKRLQSIISALRRIDEGTYGKCEKCGGEIAQERLEVSPEATICMKCAQANE
jgi:DnaK suppressor protein